MLLRVNYPHAGGENPELSTAYINSGGYLKGIMEWILDH